MPLNSAYAPPRAPAPAREARTARWSGAEVWVVDLDDLQWDVAASARCLTPAERAHAERGLPAVHRRRVLLRAALREVVGELLGVPADRAPIVTEDGRPVVLDRGAGPLGVSCSASSGVGVIAAAPGAQVGVDVERHRDEDAEQAWGEGWLAEPERLALERLPRAERLRAVTRCWTQKEAVLKGRGVGLHVAPETVRTPVSAHGTCGEWSLHPVPVPAEFVASLAVRSPDPVTETRVHRLLPGGMR